MPTNESCRLPAGWKEMMHYSGIPFFLHISSQSISWTKPYTLPQDEDLQTHVPPPNIFEIAKIAKPHSSSAKPSSRPTRWSSPSPKDKLAQMYTSYAHDNGAARKRPKPNPISAPKPNSTQTQTPNLILTPTPNLILTPTPTQTPNPTPKSNRTEKSTPAFLFPPYLTQGQKMKITVKGIEFNYPGHKQPVVFLQHFVHKLTKSSPRFTYHVDKNHYTDGQKTMYGCTVYVDKRSYGTAWTSSKKSSKQKASVISLAELVSPEFWPSILESDSTRPDVSASADATPLDALLVPQKSIAKHGPPIQKVVHLMKKEVFQQLEITDERILKGCLDLKIKTPLALLREHERHNPGTTLHLKECPISSIDTTSAEFSKGMFQTILTYGNRVCTSEAQPSKQSSKHLAAAYCLAQLYPNCRTYVELLKVTESSLSRKKRYTGPASVTEEQQQGQRQKQALILSPPKHTNRYVSSSSSSLVDRPSNSSSLVADTHTPGPLVRHSIIDVNNARKRSLAVSTTNDLQSRTQQQKRDGLPEPNAGTPNNGWWPLLGVPDQVDNSRAHNGSESFLASLKDYYSHSR